MGIDSPKYDVAISFLSADEATAAAIYQKLSEGLEVFFYPENQKELAGTEGMASMREPFFDDSRVVVVLYREAWGKTPWTRVEETAIKEGCLQHGWERLFFVALDRTSAIPVWVPRTHVRFNYADFGLEQAVGAIKARVQEQGGHPQPMTAIKRAEIFEAAKKFQRDKSRMNSEDGVQRILENVRALFSEIETQCAQISSRGSLKIRCGNDFNSISARQMCCITDGSIGMIVTWYQPYSNTLSDSALIVAEYRGGLILPAEVGSRMYVQNPQLLNETKYSPDLSLAREYGWTLKGKDAFLSSVVLAQQCVIQFVDLASRNILSKKQTGWG